MADEVEPNGFFARYTYRVYRSPQLGSLPSSGLQGKELKKGNIFLKLLYFAIELPLMLLAFLVAPALTHPWLNSIGELSGLAFGYSGPEHTSEEV